MNELHKAYAVLGLEPGSSLESIMRRYKRLIMVWHPDRAPSPEHKEFAEEELKKINNAKDLLNKHFGAGGGHKATGCRCQPDQEKPAASSTRSSTSGSSPGPNYQRTKSADEKYREDQAARKRNADRKAREEQEANARKAREAQEEQQRRATQQSMENAMQQQKALTDEKLRWKVSVGIILAFIGLEVFGCMAIGVKQWWHDFTWKWQNQRTYDEPRKKDDTPVVATDTSTVPATTATTIDTSPPVVSKPDPCAGVYPSVTPPEIILPNLHNWVRQAATSWTVKCNGNNQGATVTGSDEKGRLLDLQEYGPSWVITQQWTFKYGWAGSGEEITVDLYKPAFDFMGRSIYDYDADHNLLEVRQLDEHQRAIVTATIQRSPGGGFYQTLLKSFDTGTGALANTRTLYDPADPYMASTFYQYGMFGNISKTVSLPSDFSNSGTLFPQSSSPPKLSEFLTKPVDPSNTQGQPSSSSLPSLQTRFGLNSVSSPSSTSFSEFMKRHDLNSDSTLTPPSHSFFGNNGSLSNTPSSSRFSELLKKLETKPSSR